MLVVTGLALMAMVMLLRASCHRVLRKRMHLVVQETYELLLKPQWADDFECSDGVWGTNTRGDGEADAYRPGTYRLLSANWGGSCKDPAEQAHINYLKTSPWQVLCLQEADEAVFSYLRSPSRTPAARCRSRGDGDGGGAQEKRADGNEGVQVGPRRGSQSLIGVHCAGSLV